MKRGNEGQSGNDGAEDEDGAARPRLSAAAAARAPGLAQPGGSGPAPPGGARGTLGASLRGHHPQPRNPAGSTSGRAPPYWEVLVGLELSLAPLPSTIPAPPGGN